MKKLILFSALLLSSSAFASYQKNGPCADQAARKSLEAVMEDGIHAKVVSAVQESDASEYGVLLRVSAQSGGSMRSLVSVKVDAATCQALDITNVQWLDQN